MSQLEALLVVNHILRYLLLHEEDEHDASEAIGLMLVIQEDVEAALINQVQPCTNKFVH